MTRRWQPMRMSVLLRLTLWNASVLALLLVVFAVAAWFTITRVVQQRANVVVRESARAVAGAILAERRAAAARGEVEAVRGEHEQAVLRELRVGDLDIFITDESAQLMAVRQPRPELGENSPEPTGVRVPDPVRTVMNAVRADREAGRLSDSAVVVRTVRLDEGPARAAVLRVEPDADLDDDEPALLVTALRLETEDLLLLRQVRTTLLLAIPLALLVSVVAGYLLARRSLAPLEAIVVRTAGITAADLSQRLPVVNPHDELGRLAQIINGLLERVDAAFGAQRQFVADASHELRTPLAIIRGEADVTLRRTERPEQEYREALAVIHAESLRLTRIVDDLFLLARVDAGGAALAREPVRLADVVQDAVRSVRTLADTRQLRVELDGELGDATVTGDALLLHRLLLNLLDNARKHAPAGSAVTVMQRAVNAEALISVRDEGPGIPEADRERVFERFVHGVHPDRPAGGAGLGLAIARAIATAHGGSVRVLPDSPGATVVVALPVRSPTGASA
jgi:two-component system, OmpR family, sensor kinase